MGHCVRCLPVKILEIFPKTVVVKAIEYPIIGVDEDGAVILAKCELCDKTAVFEVTSQVVVVQRGLEVPSEESGGMRVTLETPRAVLS